MWAVTAIPAEKKNVEILPQFTEEDGQIGRLAIVISVDLKDEVVAQESIQLRIGNGATAQIIRLYVIITCIHIIQEIGATTGNCRDVTGDGLPKEIREA